MHMRVSRHQNGFTMIEVMLFLAITGLLFLIGFWGTTFQVRNVRFTDGIRDLHSYMQQQYSLVSTGANPRNVTATCSNPGGGASTGVTLSDTGGTASTAGTASGCILLGKLLKFNPNTSTVTSYYVVGKRLDDSSTNPTLTGDDMTDLINSSPTISNQGVETYQINWGLTFYQSTTATASNQSQAFAFLRSPSTGKIMSFAFPSSDVDNSLAPGSDSGLRDPKFSSTDQAHNAGFCFKDGSGHKAIINLASGQRTEALDVTFDNFTDDTACVRSGP